MLVFTGCYVFNMNFVYFFFFFFDHELFMNIGPYVSDLIVLGWSVEIADNGIANF